MNHPNQPLLGLCPIGKFVFSHEDAVRQKDLLRRRLKEWKVRFVDIEEVLPDGVVRDQAHVDPVVEHLRKAQVDALFIPHCNFGTEGAAAMIARRLGVPTLLWGPRDEAPQADGSRLRDSLCGMFATSKVLRKLKVPFTYIENCRTDEPALERGIRMFLGAVGAASVFRRGVRIGHIGQRIDFFWTTIINESELLERFNVEVLPLEMPAFIAAALDRAAKGRAGYARELGGLKRSMTIEGFSDDTPMINVLAVRDQMLALAETHGLQGLAVQDFMAVIDAMGAYCFLAESFVADRLAVGYESDIHGTLSNLLLQRACPIADPPFLADVTVRHPTNDNGVLLWHAGAPLSMKHPDASVRIGSHWILPSPLSGMPHFRLREGPISVARFDGDSGDYQLAVGEGRTIAGPDTLNNYAWMEVDDWPRWERLLMEGPFIHHVGMIYGHAADALTEACKYIPGLRPLRLNRAVGGE